MLVLIRGGGDLASGIAYRLHHCGLRVVISELANPKAVRRLVSFCEAVYAGETTVEGVSARRVVDPNDSLRVLQVLAKGSIPVIIDPEGQAVHSLHPPVVVDARMTKQRVAIIQSNVQLIIGLGPGFVASENCHVAIETNRGHMLGRVIWNGEPESDTGIPDRVDKFREERVLRAPADGLVQPYAQIGEHLEQGQLVATVAGASVRAPFKGVLRGIIHPDVTVQKGLKIGDVDPRDDARYCSLISDKSLAIGGGVLEAILSRQELRKQLWS